MATAAAAAPPRAVSGEHLIGAMEAAPATVVGEVLEVQQLDTHGYLGRLRVESALVGKAAPGLELHIAWEELAPSRAVRFAEGDRVLMALEPLPGASIWLGRIPDPDLRTRTVSPALAGDAFLRNPSPGSLDLLSHYLMLEPGIREGPTGVSYLAWLAAVAELPLAASAVARLAEVPALDERLEADGAEALVVALLRTDAPAALQDALLALVEKRRLETLRPALRAQVPADAPPPPLVISALASLDGGLTHEELARLAEGETSVEERRVAARWARGTEAADLLARLVRDDPDPAVRSNAVARLVELEGAGGASRAAAALYDPEPAVRTSAATSLGSLGAAAVPELVTVTERGDRDAAQAAVAGLLLTRSAEGDEALRQIAKDHPDPGVRNLARLALGEDPTGGH